MKKQKLFLHSVLITLCLAAFSCSKNDNPEQPDRMAEYTVMLYGCGGGNLDPSLMLNLEEACTAGSTERVQMTAQIKFSAPYQQESGFEYKGTQRLLLDGNRFDKVEQMDVSLPLYKPENLAEFIRWSKQQCPARKYILILWNHGDGWTPWSDSPKSKGVIFDDNIGGEGMSVAELVEGVKQSGVQLEVLYYDACLMNMLENLGEVQPIARYALGAAHSTPGIGGEYGVLLDLLDKGTDIETIGARYCRAVIAHWSVTDPSPKDITMTRLSGLPDVFAVLKKVSDELVATYADNSEEYDAALDNTYLFAEPEDFDSFPFIDIADYVEQLADASGNAKLFTYASQLQLAVDDAVVCQRTYIGDRSEVSWGVTLVPESIWSSYKYEESPYQTLAFDKATGWSRWLKMNNSGFPETDDSAERNAE